MASQHMNRILCAADPRGSVDMIAGLLDAADEHQVDAVAMVGDIGERGGGYRAVFRAFARARRPVSWVPGPGDAPVERYLQEAFSIETAFPSLRGVHGTAASASGELLFAGFGGEIDDDPGHARDEREKLTYPRWEAEYRLKVLREFDYNELVMLFCTAPAHKGLGRVGSEAVAELVGTYRPHLVVCGGEPSVETLGRSIVVAPGGLPDGRYAVADLRERTAMLHELTASAGSSR
jgi:Icc-related predicted phosphoesterase